MTSPQEYEKAIKEERLKLADEKGYLGQQGKIAIVMRNLGQPIMYHASGGGLIEQRYLDDLNWDYNDEGVEDARTAEELRDRMPMEEILNPDGSDPSPGGEDSDDLSWRDDPTKVYQAIEPIGWRFDGLSRGMHLEIQYLEHTHTFKVLYKGYEVYKEIKGDLVCYVPHKEWEEWIDRLFKIVKPKELAARAEAKKEEIIEIEAEKASWFESLRRRWGI
jgi:hypothetical protein